MKLWGGRFEKTTNKAAESFHSSISFDKRLYNEDIDGSIAHAEMLVGNGIISADDGKAIVAGLSEIRQKIEDNIVQFDESSEDIHMNIEKLLTELIGEAGKRLHTARSRNDQVALDMKLYVKRKSREVCALIKNLLVVLHKISSENLSTFMPGYTHLQKAQPITLAHHIGAYMEMFRRDYGRMRRLIEFSLKESPLGACALAVTTHSIDREQTANALGFEAPMKNSLDAVSDRDYAIELLSHLSILMMHMSRFCEEIVLWSTDEFGFIELDDAFSTGSSIMPQKKNPDMAELIRGKTGRVYGDLTALLTVMKGLPLAYNKDMQEDKEAVFDALDTALACLPVFTEMLATAKINRERMEKGARGGFTNATDAADWLVKNGTAFRDAHEIIGRLVIYAVKNGKSLDELTLSEYREVSPVFDETIFEAISLSECVNSRGVAGGPAKEAMEAYLSGFSEFLERI